MPNFTVSTDVDSFMQSANLAAMKAVLGVGSGSTQLVFASSAGALDANLDTGEGTDDTAAIQAILDLAQDHPIHLIMDGPARVTGLDVYSNTTIECLQGAGFYLADDSDRPIIRNANPSTGAITDRNIQLIGGRYEGNAANQIHSLPDNTHTVVIGMFGVEDFRMTGVEISNPKTYSFHASNIKRFWIEGTFLNINTGVGVINQDGIHIDGPASMGVIRDTFGTAYDDFISVASNNQADDYNAGTDDYKMGEFVSEGEITDILIDGVAIEDSLFGVTLRSSTNLLDRVTVRNVSGTCRAYGFLMDAHQYGGTGVFGAVTLDGYNVTHTTDESGYAAPGQPGYCGIVLRDNAENIVLRNIQYNNPIDDRPLIWVKTRAEIEQLTIDGVSIADRDGGAIGATMILIEGQVSELVLKGAHWRRDASLDQDGSWIKLNGGEAEVNHLILNDVSANRAQYIANGADGDIDEIQACGIRHTDTSGATFRIPSGTVGNITLSNWFSNGPIWSGGGAVTTDHGDAFLDGGGYGEDVSSGASGTPLVESTTAGGTIRNDFTGSLGFRFTVGTTGLVVSHVGRWVLSGNSGAHTVRIINPSTGATLASASVNTIGASPNAYRYTALSSPLTLDAATSYALVSDEIEDGDQWRDFIGTIVDLTSDATHNAAGYSVDGAPFVDSSANLSYVPVNLRYTLAP